jgi:hypothetical protein
MRQRPDLGQVLGQVAGNESGFRHIFENLDPEISEPLLLAEARLDPSSRPRTSEIKTSEISKIKPFSFWYLQHNYNLVRYLFVAHLR